MLKENGAQTKPKDCVRRYEQCFMHAVEPSQSKPNEWNPYCKCTKTMNKQGAIMQANLWDGIGQMCGTLNFVLF